MAGGATVTRTFDRRGAERSPRALRGVKRSQRPDGRGDPGHGASTPGAGRVTVLESKLHPPPSRPGLVERTGLLRRLRSAEASVVVVGAPAGYGKTVLLSQYAAVAGRPLAWLSLDAADADPVLLALELATAIDRVAAVDARAFGSLGTTAPALERVVLPCLLNGLAAAAPLALVLDDLHTVESEGSLAVVATLCEALPPGVTLLVASRDTSALPLGALRVRGRLVELGWRDLALSRAEAEQLMHAAGVPPAARDLDGTLARTEGWPTAVYLDALAAAGADDRPRLAPDARADRDLVDYLWGALLRQLPPERLEFLRRTSILERISAPVCDALLGRRDSAREIAELERSNLFVQPLDRSREWYRYHHLFRDVLRAELERMEARCVPSLHRRASTWHEREGTPEGAVEHALAARDMPRAAELVVRLARGLINVGRLATVRRWLDGFPEDEIARSAALALTAAWVRLLQGERDPARRYVAVATGAPWQGVGPNGEPSLESAVALIKGLAGWDGVSRMHTDALTAYGLLPLGHPAHELAALGLGCSVMLLGRSEQAVPLLEEAAALGASRASAAVVAYGLLAQIALDGGRPDAAAASAEAGLALVADLRLESVASASVNLAAACLAADRGDRARATVHMERVMVALPGMGAAPWRSIRARLLLGRAALAIGDLRLAKSLLDEARRELPRYPDAGVLPRLLAREERALDGARGGGGVLREPLTPAELRVLELLPTHLSTLGIGEALHISRNTVKAHLRGIYRKLDATTRSDAVERAGRHGLLPGRD